MNNSYGQPGVRAGNKAPSTWHAALAVIGACLGGGGICVGALFGIRELNSSTSGLPDATKDFDAWWAATRIRSVQEILLAVSALQALVLIAGAVLLLLGKSAGRPAVLIGSAWGFFGGLITATYGGEYGVAAQSAASPFYLILGAALCSVALVAIATSPPGRPTVSPAPLPQPGHRSPVPQFGTQPPTPQFGAESPMPQSGAASPVPQSGAAFPVYPSGGQPPEPQFGQHPPAPQSRSPR
ncbi:hypothetical protein [Nocardia sputorum]|uniref:Uncharacterized protein n=1 Tax=Nocardia sputorum TaxID=2984338 RepID=A0ABM8D7X2_9NOCA|nr:hypothetical protein [Nocardia sputorum]BDU03527.1 hypothetical protein IFM12276_65550 [Nocardia sputorum]